jgi:hypothetical protein
MYIEFTGCSGVGKSTISERVIALLRSRGDHVMSVHEVYFTALGPRFEAIRHPTLQNLLLDAYGVQHCVRSQDCRDFVQLADSLLCRHTDSLLRGLNLRRSVVRKLGVHALMLLQNRKTFRLVDEGIVHSAHNLFVRPRSLPDDAEIEAFAARVPLADVIVWVRAPPKTVFDRTLMRPSGRWLHRRRLGASDLRRYVEHGCMVFDKLMANLRISERTIQIDSGSDQLNAADRLAEKIVERACAMVGHA